MSDTRQAVTCRCCMIEQPHDDFGDGVVAYRAGLVSARGRQEADASFARLRHEAIRIINGLRLAGLDAMGATAGKRKKTGTTSCQHGPIKPGGRYFFLEELIV